ncbi:Spo0B domain-containing protein [Paenibacillus hexagrammi]|uniref:Spo0B domain-containing protein n=1 Tax=Paenibacillus hexagrammi TaxID=2908839 RepID=A0ABY3SDH9_9BACL|nr:Spo0B domain-containing protein [Paenibacillus sp. YPD9-1]UJF31991.1 Spo0B domain-containing protein [Paenibacillus sp. YPD9-1]
MKRASSAQIYLMAITLLALTGLLFMESWVIRTGLLLITVISGYTAMKMQVSRVQEAAIEEQRRKETEYHSNVLQIVNRMRHDWMNDIQILFGYIQLKKFDNLQPYMEKIKTSMQQESNLSKLGIPALITYLFMFRVQSKSLQLEIGLDQEVNLQQLPVRSSLIQQVVQKTVELLQRYSMAGDEEIGVISLEFDIQDDHLLLDFVYQGPYREAELSQAIETERKKESNEYKVDELELHSEEVVLAIRLPFPS